MKSLKTIRGVCDWVKDNWERIEIPDNNEIDVPKLSDGKPGNYVVFPKGSLYNSKSVIIVAYDSDFESVEKMRDFVTESALALAVDNLKKMNDKDGAE